MGITLTPTSALALSCHESIESRATAHPVLVGLSGVRGAEFHGAKLSDAWQMIGSGKQATGGVRIAQPRNTQLTINVQQPLNAYGTPLDGTSVRAAKGSLMAKPLAPATAEASGVPPRGRPV